MSGCPFLEHLYDVEEELQIKNRTRFVLASNGDQWYASKHQILTPLRRVQTVRRSRDTFEFRMPLKKEWAGLRDEELAKVSGVEGAVFVHILFDLLYLILCMHEFPLFEVVLCTS